MYYVLAFLFALSAFALSEVEYRGAFERFKVQYGKTYLDAEEEHRYTVFKSNLDFVNSWDEAARGFSVKINKFSDLTAAEFARIYNGLNITRTPTFTSQKKTKDQVLADTVDWRTKGAVTGVKDQGQCGSCWSFSATGSMEAAHFFATGQLVSLSEQNLVDCSTTQGNEGCNGGLMDYAFEYVIANHGIDTEDSYRYTATGPNSCRFNSANVGATISSYQDIPTGSESDLESAVNGRPVSVAIDASHSSFQMYSGGVYYESACSSSRLDHGVLAVGYGTDGSDDYWIVKNSWGSDWGMSGYINMARNKNNNCGIATAASYPVA